MHRKAPGFRAPCPGRRESRGRDPAEPETSGRRCRRLRCATVPPAPRRIRKQIRKPRLCAVQSRRERPFRTVVPARSWSSALGVRTGPRGLSERRCRSGLMVCPVRSRMVYAPGGHDGGNRVLENELFLIVGLEHERVFIEALDPPRKFHAAEEIDGDQSLFLARIIQKAVLYVLRRFIHGASKRPEKLKERPQAGPIAF